MVDWQVVLNDTDTQSAYSKFHEVISTKYNACFLICKISEKYYKNITWLSSALKESMKNKNKLYRKSKKSGDSEKVSFYEKYRNKLSQFIRSAERKKFSMIYCWNTSRI